ncbi:MAG: response regulator [Nitrosomonadales bacterium]|nr:response regulator [Nitrosomonadales bacterium]
MKPTCWKTKNRGKVKPLLMDTYRILLLDDDDFILSILRRELVSRPYVGHDGLEIEAFTSPIAALARAHEKDGYFDVVIADNYMPEMKGIDFLKLFGEIHPDAARIVLSGQSDAADLIRAINEAHIDFFITKPWQDYDLKCKLLQALRLFDVRYENRRLAKLYFERFGMQHQTQRRNKFKLMAVDDDPRILKELERELSEPYTQSCFGMYQLEVRTFASTEAALSAARAEKFDIVISDYAMPLLDGVEFLRMIKEVQPDAVRILISDVAEMSVLIASVNEAGVNHFVSKPWHDYELRIAIDRALSHREMEQENCLFAKLLQLKTK